MFKTVLVHVDNETGSNNRIQAAIDLARQFDARLIGLTAGLPRLPIEMYDVSLGTVAIGDYSAFDRRHVEAEFSKSEASFRRATEGSDLETTWRAVFGAPSLAVVGAATVADIIVVGPGDYALLGDMGSAAAGDIVLRTGRPVLVVPQEVDSIQAQNIVVAWKDTPESQRAMADALPFMKRAASVVVATVEEREDSPSNVADAATFLVRHGVAAKTEIIKSNGGLVVDQILNFAKRGQADLIVAGAYGHSRLREWVFGGVTRGLLMQSGIHCLFSH